MNEFAALVGPFWSAEHVQAALDLPDISSLDDLVRHGDLLGVPIVGGGVVYPVSQFRIRAEKVEVIPAVQALLRRLSALDPWTTAVALAAPREELRGASPNAWARERGVDITLARLVGRLAAELA